MPRRRIRWTNCRPIKLRNGTLDVLVAALRITPSRLPYERVSDEWWEAVVNDPRARRRPQRTGYSRADAPVLTIGELQTTGQGGWAWAYCGRGSTLCDYRMPIAFAPFAIQWGRAASSNLIRQNLVCGRCGHRGVTHIAPSWGETRTGFEAFPAT